MTSVPLANANFALELAERSRAGDHASGLVTASGATSYDALWLRAGQLRRVLADCGVARGDRVVVQVDKSIEAVAFYLAVLAAGAVYVPLNVAYKADELAYFVADAEPTLLVLTPGVAAPDSYNGRSETLAADTGSLGPLADSSEPDPTFVERGPDDPAAMLYTSGTTGRSKGAVLTHDNLRQNARALHDGWGFHRGDTLLHILPIFHVHGLFVALHCAFLAGCRVLFHDRFSVEATIDALPSATVMMGVPTHYARLVNHEGFSSGQCRNLRLFTSGSAPMTAHVHAEVERRCGHRVLERYGMSEAGIITSNPLDGDRVAGTVGFALPGVDLRIADDQGEPVASGTTGTVEIRGPHLFGGYWRKPAKTAEAFRSDGYFITGDVGSVDEHGRLTLEGRKGDMIISGGYNVYPKEVELLLDAVDGVHESAVIGLPDEDFGEVVVAVIVGTAEEAALRTALADEIATFKQPRRYVFANELPRNTMGKVQKQLLRSQV